MLLVFAPDHFPSLGPLAQADLKKHAPGIFKWILEVVSAGPGVPILHRVAACTLTSFLAVMPCTVRPALAPCQLQWCSSWQPVL